PIDGRDGGLGGLALAHPLQQRAVACQEFLGLRRQGGPAVQLGHHLPGGEIAAGPGVGASRAQHIGSFDQVGLGPVGWCTGVAVQLRVARQKENSLNHITGQ
ncbi:hypothetical protein KXW36_001668, partial [Aspergillus fumigatus]